MTQTQENNDQIHGIYQGYPPDEKRLDMTQEQTHSAGALRAATQIDSIRNWDGSTPFVEIVADIIDRETHASVMEAFIEKVAAIDLANRVVEIQDEAETLIKKARG